MWGRCDGNRESWIQRNKLERHQTTGSLERPSTRYADDTYLLAFVTFSCAMSGVAQIRNLQLVSLGHMSRRVLMKLTSPSLVQPACGAKPYAVLSISEYGVCKRWTWSGAHLDDESEYSK